MDINTSDKQQNDFLEFCTQSFKIDQPNLNRFLYHAHEIAQQTEFEDDLTILEMVFRGS